MECTGARRLLRANPRARPGPGRDASGDLAIPLLHCAAWLHRRHEVDVAPARIQSWLSRCGIPPPPWRGQAPRRGCEPLWRAGGGPILLARSRTTRPVRRGDGRWQASWRSARPRPVKPLISPP
jgi:hypothetical protein